MIQYLLFDTSKLLNINDITKRIGNFFKLPIQLSWGIAYPELALIHYTPLSLPGQINFNDGSRLGISRVVVRTDFSFIQAPGASGFVGRGDDAVAEVGGKLGFEGVEFDEFLHGEAHG